MSEAPDSVYVTKEDDDISAQMQGELDVFYSKEGLTESTARAAVKYVRADIHAALEAENERMRRALDRADRMIDALSNAALREGLAGTSHWDNIAGGCDMYGVQDEITAALSHTEKG